MTEQYKDSEVKRTNTHYVPPQKSCPFENRSNVGVCSESDCALWVAELGCCSIKAIYITMMKSG